MSHIIAARFQLIEAARDAKERLVDMGNSADQISIFYVTPPGQHGAYPIGGDHAKSPERHANSAFVSQDDKGTATSGVSRPEETVTSNDRHIDPQEARFRNAGILLAIAFENVTSELCDRSVEALAEMQAFDFEQTTGTIAGGDWVDFDPVSLPQPLDERLALICQLEREVLTY